MKGAIMFSRAKTLAGALALCAVSICAFAAASASAAPELTAVTCKEKVGGKYNTSHCETPITGSGFETEVLPLNVTTEVTAKSVTEPALRATIAGAKITIKCASSEAVGAFVANTEPSAGKHTISTKVTRNTYSNCHAYLKENETRKCVVVGTTEPGGEGMISTKALKGTTTGVNHQVKLEPVEGTEIVKFTIKKAGTNAATEKECFFGTDVPVSVTGSVECEADTTKHSHKTCTEANNGTALKANGATVNYIDTVVATMAGGGTTVGAETFT
jgi:hypothetical protein